MVSKITSVSNKSFSESKYFLKRYSEKKEAGEKNDLLPNLLKAFAKSYP